MVLLNEDSMEDLRWWVTHGRRLNVRALMLLPVVSRDSYFVVDGRGLSAEGWPSVGGLDFVNKRFLSTVVPREFAKSPVHVIEAVALLVAVRLWLWRIASPGLIPIGSDNMAVVHAVQGGKAKDPALAALARLLWGLFACHGSDCLLRYVPTVDNKSDGVSRLNGDHVSFLLSQGWIQDLPSESMFSIDENSPFLFQEENQVL